MDTIVSDFNTIKRAYDEGRIPLVEIGALALLCIRRMELTDDEDYGLLRGKPYHVRSIEIDSRVLKSRPYRADLMILDAARFERSWVKLLASRNQLRYVRSGGQINECVYSVVMSFCICYDIWKNGSRKTPGTYFEVVLGALIQNILPGSYLRTKSIPLLAAAEIPDEEKSAGGSNLSTDIVFQIATKKYLVIPVKITTRERVVQPFAHQRILDSSFGDGAYTSLLCCVSETQREDKRLGVNEICVPGTIKLFQKHLAKLGGIFYLDPPEKYLALDGFDSLNVTDIGVLLSQRLKEIITAMLTPAVVPKTKPPILPPASRSHYRR